MKLFKYCTESGIHILGSGQLRLSPPYEFNDPFEFAVNVKPVGITKEKLKRYLRQPRWFDDWRQINRSGQPEEIAREYYFSHLDQIADEMMATFPENVKREQASSCNRASQFWAVGCFSEQKHSILMWSHYSDHHRGMVIEFDTSFNPFNLPGFPGFFVKVRYSKKKPVFLYQLGMKGFPKQFRIMASHKHRDWRYERERRIIMPRTSLIDGEYMPISHEAIRSVTFGQRCPEQLRITVHSLLRQPEFRHVSVYEAVLNNREYKLDFNQLRIDGVWIPKGAALSHTTS